MIRKILFVAALAATLLAAQKLDKSFVLQTVDGAKIHVHIKQNGIEVKEYPNKVIILDFFGKRCPPCRIEMPILGDLQKRLKKKLQIIGLHVQEPLNKKDIEELKRRGINYPVCDYMPVPQNQQFVEFMGRLTGWSGTIPFMLFFDKDGNYAGYHLGMADEKSLEKFIDKLYNPPKTNPSKEHNATKK